MGSWQQLKEKARIAILETLKKHKKARKSVLLASLDVEMGISEGIAQKQIKNLILLEKIREDNEFLYLLEQKNG